MGEIKKISTVHDFNVLLDVEDRHPLVSVIDFSAYPPRPLFRALLGVYGIYIREDEPQNVVYGTSKYDFLGGTLIAIAPGQISGAEDIGRPVQRKGGQSFSMRSYCMVRLSHKKSSNTRSSPTK